MAGIFTKRIWQPYTCQPKELKREIKKNTGGPNGVPSKNLEGHGQPRPSSESPLIPFDIRYNFHKHKKKSAFKMYEEKCTTAHK